MLYRFAGGRNTARSTVLRDEAIVERCSAPFSEAPAVRAGPRSALGTGYLSFGIAELHSALSNNLAYIISIYGDDYGLFGD